MSEIILNSELLNNVTEGREISKDEAYQIYQSAHNEPSEVYKAAEFLRNKNKGSVVTYSRKVFFNLINLCRDTCSYCTYKAEPGQAKISMLTRQEIENLATMGKKHKCTEALFVTGEKPEQRYQEAKAWLKENGFRTTTEYIIHASETALRLGLFPHTNAGNLTKSEMNELKKTNVSLGLMLENSSERLAEKNMPHEFAPSKNPKVRIHILENAGELSIPMTTGILIGIGETPFELIDSIYTIKELNKRYGHIQEIILQNFQPKFDTKMRNSPRPNEKYFRTIIALTRIIMPEMNIQIPPNLSPNSYSDYLSAGINDWGGISPVTPDFVNPEYSWPTIENVRNNCLKAGFELRARFPIYPEFFSMMHQDLQSKVLELSDSNGLVREEYMN